METFFTVLKILGSLAGIIAAVILVARLWSGASREQLIHVLKEELKLAQEHCERADQDVINYRQEMHDVRNSCQDKLTLAQNELDKVKELLKRAELESVRLGARPDLTSIATLLERQATTMQSLDDSLKSHSQGDAEIFERMIKRLDEHTARSDERMVECLRPVQEMCAAVVAALDQTKQTTV